MNPSTTFHRRVGLTRHGTLPLTEVYGEKETHTG